ncbi:MAG: hypothetical protein H6589_10475 [Flavobacteriales bacterium]|nr:hypothetical protein [Flavobacteriales bacterium]
MRKHILLFLLIIGSISIHAQDVIHFIRLNPDSALNNIRFSCLDVLDARTNTENIGNSIGPAGAVAQLEGGFTESLKTTLLKMLPQQENKLGLVFIIRELEISERVDEINSFGFCNLEIEFAKKVDTLLFSLGVFDAHIVSKGLKITDSHDKRILMALEECVLKLDQTNWENAQEILIDDIHHKLVYDYKSVPPKGAYLNFQSMLRRTPIDSNELQIRQYNASKKNPIYAIKSNNTDLPKNVQFASDGENIYLHISKYEFAKSTVIGKYIYFQGKFPPTTNPEIDAAAAAGFVVAGVITGILTGVVFLPAGGGSGNNAPINGLVLDTETGQLKGLTDYNLVNYTKPYPEILKEYRSSKRNLEAKENVIKQLNAKFE